MLIELNKEFIEFFNKLKGKTIEETFYYLSDETGTYVYNCYNLLYYKLLPSEKTIIGRIKESLKDKLFLQVVDGLDIPDIKSFLNGEHNFEIIQELELTKSFSKDIFLIYRVLKFPVDFIVIQLILKNFKINDSLKIFQNKDITKFAFNDDTYIIFTANIKI